MYERSGYKVRMAHLIALKIGYFKASSN